MLLLAHVGYTTSAVRISQTFALRRPFDYRLVVILASPHACDYDSVVMESLIQYAQTADGAGVFIIDCAS